MNRQLRLQGQMEQNRWDGFLTCNYRTVYYLTGSLAAPETPVLFFFRGDGRSVLITPGPTEVAADEVIPLESYSLQRSITRPYHDALEIFRKHVTLTGLRNLAAEIASVPAIFNVQAADAMAVLLKLRKRKEPDEIEEIRESLRYCTVAYRAAQQAIKPGRTELEVYTAMYAAVVKEAGSTVEFPGDFACGVRAIRRGGPPTRNSIRIGDLYILDIFPAPALYFGDTCRTFAAGVPTDLQFRAWELVRDALRIGESMVKPGVRARDVYWAIKSFLDSHEMTEGSFWHHAGHGIGHHGHEAPRIIPASDDIFEVGDLITLEPGVYTRALQGGIRLEDNYVVREDRIENLFDYPLELR